MGYFDPKPPLGHGTVATGGAPIPATSGTTLTMDAGHAARLVTDGAPTVASPLPLTLAPPLSDADLGDSEIVWCTNVDVGTNTLTIIRAREGTTAMAVASGWRVIAGPTRRTFSQIQNAIWAPASEFISFGTSLTTGFGGSSAEFSWPARYAKATDVELAVYGQNGAILTIDDTNSTTDGGWPTVFKRLKPPRTAHPRLSGWGTVSFDYGLNDISNFGTSNPVRDAYKACLRAIIGDARSSQWFAPNVAPVTKNGASHASLTGSEDSVINGRLDYITAADGSNWELAVPADYIGGGAVWIYTLSQPANGMLANVTVDGGAPASINNQAATTIDTRGLATLANVNTVHAWRIPVAAAGAHTVRLTPTAINGGVASIQGFSIEAEVPSVVTLPLQYKLPSYAPFSGAPFPVSDAAIDSLNSWIAAVAAELTDGRVITVDRDTPINKLSRYLHTDGVHLNDAGSEVVAAAVFDALRAANLLEGRTIMASAKKGSILIARQPVKRPCRCASTANVNIASAPATIDGVTLLPFDRVLLKHQTNATENWIYRWLGPSRPMERDDDADSSEEVFAGLMVQVQEGASLGQNRAALFMIANQGAITLGTTPIRVTRIAPDVMLQPQRSVWTPGSNAIETIPGGVTTATAVASLASGRLSLIGGIVIPAGQPISTITFHSIGAAASPTQQLAGLYRQSNLARLAVSANKTTTAWAVNSASVFTLTATYTPDEDMMALIGLMVVASTVPTLAGTNPIASVNTVAPIKHGSSNTGLTTSLPDPANALSALAGLPYAYIQGP